MAKKCKCLYELLGESLDLNTVQAEAGGVCLEGVRCTVGGSEIQVLIAMNCFILKHTNDMLWFEGWELHALLCICMLCFRRVESRFDC